MLPNSRVFQAGPDPRGQTWEVQLVWLQTGISIRHSDTVDVKFLLASPGERLEKVVSLRHADLLALSRKSGRPITDPWCMRLAGLHLRHMIETDEDLEKTLVECPLKDLERYNAALEASFAGGG